MQEDNHVFQGMKRSGHQIRQEANFLWDAHNIRLTNRADDTLLSITNEKGTLDTGVSLEGCYVGHCVLGKYLVVFTSDDDSTNNRIYRIEKKDNGYESVVLFHEGDVYEGAWSPYHPIETVGIYETELVQKVYWIDGINQPKVINITKDRLLDIKIPSNKDLTTALNYNTNSFDFTRVLNLNETIRVNKVVGYGEFSPGMIQYAFTYYDKYSQESNIFYVTPLHHVSPLDRGESPDKKVSCSFRINVTNYDDFEYIRIYSIHRTSLDSVPTVKVVSDIETKSKTSDDKLEYTDTGTSGYTIDPTLLLYIGGTSIVPQTLTAKDGTLFFGNIKVSKQGSNIEVLKTMLSSITEDEHLIGIDSAASIVDKTFYKYNPNLDSYSAGFKVGESYRCGIQFQDKFGKWTDPIHIKDIVLNDSPIWETFPNRKTKAFDLASVVQSLLNNGYKRARACVVFPKPGERDVICQGVLCPTVYSVSGRVTNSPYSMASWFFRPAVNLNRTDSMVGKGKYFGANIQYQHNKALFTLSHKGAEIQSMIADKFDVKDINYEEAIESNKYSSQFYVDENLVTLNSPDLEFDDSLSSLLWDDTKLRIIGVAYMGAVSGDIDIRTSTPPASSNAIGFNHVKIGYQTNTNTFINGGLVSGFFYGDGAITIDNTGNVSVGDHRLWMVYPWHRSGSLNNDKTRQEGKGTRTAVLQKKKISNLKFFDRNTSFDEFPIDYDISVPQLFNHTELSMSKVKLSYPSITVPYLGNVDTLLSSNSKYGIVDGGNFTDTPNVTSTTVNYKSNDPVRIKYKSSPHLVFSLTSKENNINLLPRYDGLPSRDNEVYNVPRWQANVDNIEENNSDEGIPYDGVLYECSTFGPLINSDPSDSIIGMYVICPATIRWEADGPGGSREPKPEGGGLYIAERTPTGTSWRLLQNSESNGKILKAATGVTKVHVYRNTGYLPGTISIDYDNYTYIGKNIYYKYKPTTIGSSGPNYTDGLSKLDTSSNNSGSTGGSTQPTDHKLKQLSFGKSYKTNNPDNYDIPPYLLLAEIVRNNVINKFGGDSDSAKQENIWFPASEPVILDKNAPKLLVPFEYGDTWYSRYDCLKTYPFTQEDENQVVEIGSFMCETRVNIDGRYDRNRGQLSNLNMTPQNFNLINNVYSQKDNFFNYRILDKDYYKQNVFSNQVTWSKEKHAGEDIDSWTNITLANTLDLNGEKGNITALRTWNENLLCFQEKALSQILFNSRVQVPTSDGVPIEISNGYKVDGSRLLGDGIGCSNKWAIVNGTSGIYFLDSKTDSLYIFNGQLTNLSRSNGMDWWTKQNHTNRVWNPMYYGDGTLNGIRAFYDSKHGDVYFTPGPVYNINQPDALCYSEQLGQFTSLMSYGGTQAMFNFEDGFYSLRDTNGKVRLYLNNAGPYNTFYGVTKGWDFSFVSNQNPTYTKIFDTVELRADNYSTYGMSKLLDSCPTNFIEVKNEYQDSGTVSLGNKNMRKKFRVWRGLLPRNKNTRDRMRNPWSMIKLGWTPPENGSIGDNTMKAIIHDVSVKYTV